MKFLEEKLKRKMGGWMDGTMTIGGRLTKIDACLSSVAVYQMSMRLLHETNIENLDIKIRSLFQAGCANKRKYHFAQWRWTSKLKPKYELWVKDLTKFNISMMCNGGGSYKMGRGLGKIS
jgi:hypothetical protein